jgi:hypothetical protein
MRIGRIHAKPRRQTALPRDRKRARSPGNLSQAKASSNWCSASSVMPKSMHQGGFSQFTIHNKDTPPAPQWRRYVGKHGDAGFLKIVVRLNISNRAEIICNRFLSSELLKICSNTDAVNALRSAASTPT